MIEISKNLVLNVIFVTLAPYNGVTIATALYIFFVYFVKSNIC